MNLDDLRKWLKKKGWDLEKGKVVNPETVYAPLTASKVQAQQDFIHNVMNSGPIGAWYPAPPQINEFTCPYPDFAKLQTGDAGKLIDFLKVRARMEGLNIDGAEQLTIAIDLKQQLVTVRFAKPFRFKTPKGYTVDSNLVHSSPVIDQYAQVMAKQMAQKIDQEILDIIKQGQNPVVISFDDPYTMERQYSVKPEKENQK